MLVRSVSLPHVAVQGGHCEIVEVLLANGADLNARDNLGMTPLHNLCMTPNMAVDNRRRKVAKFLLSRNTDVCARDKLGRTPLHLATASKRNNGAFAREGC